MRILVIEDHAALGRFIAATLEAAGWEVVGPVDNPDEAMAAACDLALDLVVVDRSLRGQDTFAIADLAEARGLPCLIISGYSPATLPERFRDRPFLEKPFTMDALLGAVRAVIARG